MKKIIAICLVCIVSTVNASWQQSPDLNGWDVGFDYLSSQDPIADDWLCTQTGPVTDIRFWVSWMGDKVSEITSLHVGIYSDIPYDEYTNPFSTPGNELWDIDISSVEMNYYDSGNQGFFIPFAMSSLYIANDHQNIYQIDITGIEDPFIQQEGTIYWLAISASYDNGEYPDYFHPGWKTSENHFNDGAVYLLNDYWMPLGYPPNDPQFRTGNLDLAFEIIPEPATICILGLGALSLIRKK